MTDEEYIRKAVELADGFVERKVGDGFVHYYGPSEYEFIGTHFGEGDDQFLLDALAAQLVRQVEPLCDWFEVQIGCCRFKVGTEIHKYYGSNKTDRTMNTIRAIVDSGVLEGQSDE